MSSLILDNLISVAEGLGRHFGKDCEIVIHDLMAPDPEKTILYIANGEISGRKIGDGPSGVVLKTIQRMKDGEELKDRLCYLIRTKDGRVLKSSTIFLKGEDGKYRYLFGINYDITRLVNIEEGIQSLIQVEEEAPKEQHPIPNSVNDLLDNLIEQSIALIGKQPALMTKDEKVKAIQYLNDAGAFLITKSGDKVAAHFGISKFTLYSYIDVNKRRE